MLRAAGYASRDASLGLSSGITGGRCSHEKSAFGLGGLGLSRVLSVPEPKALSR